MYVNLIDNIIDQILDRLYLQGISNDETFQTIVKNKKINFVEYREKINEFIQKFIDSIDKTPIQKIISNKVNLIRIVDIIKRYIAYYYFLSIAFYYAGTIKEYRNNLIQYSKLQENSNFVIRNFFDTENNYQIITFYKIIKDSTKILTMTEFQKKTLDPSEVKLAINFLNELGQDYVDSYLLTLKKDTKGDDLVEINVHNLIKTIVFGEIYRNQEQKMVFNILSESEETKNEYTYIEIVVTTSDTTDYENIKQIFIGEDNGEMLAKDVYDLLIETSKIQTGITLEKKINHLFSHKYITPIVDDFLRYHRDSERLETESDSAFKMPIIPNVQNAKNIQMALLYQQRKQKENTKAQLIVNKIDTISDYYSETVKKNADILKEIKKNFQGPLSHRKAVTFNYLDEMYVMNKIINQGQKVMDSNEYFLELQFVNSRSYFNFKEFQKYGAFVNLNNEHPVNMLRYSNIEFQNQLPNQEVELRSGSDDTVVAVVGLSIGPFGNDPINCVTKTNLVSIYKTTISYEKNKEIKKYKKDNGYKMYLKILKEFVVKNIVMDKKNISFSYDFSSIKKYNPDLFTKVIYWEYDLDKDTFVMDTYENIKTQTFQETIKYMLSKLSDEYNEMLLDKLIEIIEKNRSRSSKDVEDIIEIFDKQFSMNLSYPVKKDLIIKYYFMKGYQVPISISTPTESIEMPEFVVKTDTSVYRIKIDMSDPSELKEYVTLEAYSGESKTKTSESQEGVSVDKTCEHENEWNEVQKLKNQNVNRYNAAMTAFIEKFSFETAEMDFICKICGQLLPIKKYIQDGSFNNNTQKFISSYVPDNSDLEDLREYKKYRIVIKFIDNMINRMSLITGTNMLTGSNLQAVQRRKNLVKNILDIIIKHNDYNMRKNQDSNERGDFFHKKFGIEKDLDVIFFFELDDSIFIKDASKEESVNNANKLKINNIMIYLILLFFTELNGPQITMMSRDKYANIYVYLKYGPKLFQGLMLKKNINGMETEPITNYPVLCYLIFSTGYYLSKYNIWYYPGGSASKIFNIAVLKLIIHSIVDAFNSISLDAGKNQDDYIYTLTASKIYSHLTNVFRNNDIIKLLKIAHSNYSGDTSKDMLAVSKENEIPVYTIGEPVPNPVGCRKIPDFKVSVGVFFENMYMIKSFYDYGNEITTLSNCDTGDYHNWFNFGGIVKCKKCGKTYDEVNDEKDMSTAAFYFNLNKIANRKCLDGKIHDFVAKNGVFVCSICGREANTKYTKEELDKLNNSLDKIEDNYVDESFKTMNAIAESIKTEQDTIEKMMKSLISQYKKDNGDKLYGKMNNMADGLIKILENNIGEKINLEIDKYPVYLRDDVYVITTAYDGNPFPTPITFVDTDNKIFFKEDHPFFKTDVYYYIDNRVTQVNVFYHAVTLRMIGYQEKHKEFTLVKKSNNYLKINQSLKNRLLSIGFPTKYINIEKTFEENKKLISDVKENYYDILDNLIREHITKLKNAIDKFTSIINMIKYYVPPQEGDVISYLPASQNIDKLVTKYFKVLKEFKTGENDNSFAAWPEIRDSFTYEKINWAETTVKSDESNMYVNSDNINYYDVSSNLMMYYLVQELIKILVSNSAKNTQVTLCQLYVELINFIYNIYNIDGFKNSIEYKRFDYILNATEVTIDLMRKGQGLDKSKTLDEEFSIEEPEETLSDIVEDQAEEKEDIVEEAQSLDVEEHEYEEYEEYAEEAGEEV